jgi:hypothetical protein
VRAGENFLIVERSEAVPDQQESEQEAEVADAVDDEGLRGRGAGSRLLVPMADEQIGAEPDGLPEDEELQKVVRHNQHQHREGKERNVAEEAGIAGISPHVADGIDVDERAHGRDEQQHNGGKPVDGEADVNVECARGQPGVEGKARLVPARHVEEDQEREQPRHEDSRNGDKMGVVLDPMAKQPEDQERSQRKEWNEFVRHRNGILFNAR